MHGQFARHFELDMLGVDLGCEICFSDFPIVIFEFILPKLVPIINIHVKLSMTTSILRGRAQGRDRCGRGTCEASSTMRGTSSRKTSLLCLIIGTPLPRNQRFPFPDHPLLYPPLSILDHQNLGLRIMFKKQVFGTE